MGLVRNIKLKMDMGNYLLQHKIAALKTGTENTDPTKNGKKNTWEFVAERLKKKD